MATATGSHGVDFQTTIHRNCSATHLIEDAIRRDEGKLAANGALCCSTGERTGRSPKDKYLEDTPGIHDNIDWGSVNRPISPEHFAALEDKARAHLDTRPELYRFDGYCGADERHRLAVTVVTEKAWHNLFAKTLFIESDPSEHASWDPDWVILNACDLELDDPSAYGLDGPIAIIQSLEQKKVIIIGTQYAGEMKKSIFFAMNYDMPDVDVFPMHCSANVASDDPSNVALFFGLSGTGKTTLSRRSEPAVDRRR